jgi:hypothetical protein
MKIQVWSAVVTAAPVVPTPSASRAHPHRIHGHVRTVWQAAWGSHGTEAETRDVGACARRAPGTIMERHSRGSGDRTVSYAGLHFTLLNAPHADPE